MAVFVSTAVWPLIQIDKLADVNFIVAAHQFVQSCKNNCHVLSVTHLKSFVIELSRFICDSYGKSKNIGESEQLVWTFSLDVICSATIQVRRTSTVAVEPMYGLHNYRKTSELT